MVLARGDAFGRLIAAALFALPLLLAVGLGVADGLAPAAWAALAADAQWPRSLAASLWVGVASTTLALAATLWLVTRLHASALWPRIEGALGSLLAVPHAAFAIGLALLVVPSGPIARGLALVAGWDAPPDVATVQDRFGLALVAGLVLKEVPFLLWNVVAQLHRVGARREIEQQLQVAASLGYPPRSAWWRVLWPQLLPRLALPLLAVWAYGLTVVDMALVLGPTSPPTLAVLAWQWLQDGDPQRTAQGAAAALGLALLVLAGAALAIAAWRALLPAWRARAARGDRPSGAAASRAAALVARAAAVVYAAVLALLLWMSVAGVWTFPALWPQVFTLDAWRSVAASAPTLWLTAGLGLASAASGLAIAVAWLESTPSGWDRHAAPFVFLPMLVPGVLLVGGLYRLALATGVDGRFVGLWCAHTLFTAPYALVALAPAYRAFDPRLAQTAAALGRSRAAFLARVKWPMLAAPLAAAFAVGFAVSVAQYLPTQFVGAGRHATVTTEALTLAAGGQRTLTAAFALLQALLPALVFGGALALAQRQRRRLGPAEGG